MSAGMISVPAIIPLKPPGFGATGSKKWTIDTNTLIEMQAKTKDCVIFYTLNGTNPDPFKKIGDKTTFHYSKPITLLPGKRTLKAIAVLKDGLRESNVNTKVFQVSKATMKESDDEDDNRKFNSTWQTQISEDEEGYDEKTFKKVIRLSKEGKENKQQRSLVRKVLTGYISPDSSSEIAEDDYLTCPNCNAMRPRDPFARYCNECKAILPPAPGKIRSPCQKGLEETPPNPGSNRIVCKICRTSNPNTVSECLVCSESLDTPVLNCRRPAPSPSNDFIVCPYCTRVNSGDARFCDWCGEKSKTSSRVVPCHSCSTRNSVSSKYCSSCGKSLKAPLRKSFEDLMSSGNVKIKDKSAEESKMELLSKLTEDDRNWKSLEFEAVSRKETKTVGLQVGDSLQNQKISKNTKPSPGKGYWRQQAEFVSQHFKVFTQNNPSFRDEFSDHVLNKLISVEIKEKTLDDKDAKDIHLTMIFESDNTDKENKKKKKKLSVNAGETLINALSSKPPSRPSSGRSNSRSSSATRDVHRPDKSRSNSIQSNSSSRPSSGRKKKMNAKTLEKEKLETFLSKLSIDTKKLLDIIKSTKEPDIEQVEDLLNSENIDVNSTDENGIPFLKLCVLNKHFEVIPLLLDSGANIDATSGPKDTTSLHEAVLLGINGKEAVEILLDNGASQDITDKRNRTAHDIAVENGHDSVLTIFNKHTSKGLLKNALKL